MKHQLVRHQLVRPLPTGEALSIFGIQEIAGELRAILVATDVAGKSEVVVSEDEWASFMFSLSGCFGALPPSIDTWKHALDGEDQQLVVALGQRAEKALSALERISDTLGVRFGDQASLLLPITYAQRLDMVIGEGRLPIAQITQFDALTF